MKYRLLGKSGLRVSEAALGTMTFGDERGWGSPKDEAQQIYETYREANGNFIDTANFYTGGTSETFVGEFIKGHRDSVVLATKYSNAVPGNDPNAAGNHRKSMMQALEASLKRLQTDYIDLYWVHIWDGITPVEEVMRGLDDLVRQGKVLYVGISDAPAWWIAQANTLAELRGWTQFIGLQIEYSLVERTVERELIPMSKALNLAVLAWSPLAKGIPSFPHCSSALRRPLPSPRYFPDKTHGLGGVTLGNEFEVITDEVAYKTLDGAWSAGVRYYDVSPWYGLGLAERRFGNYLHNKNWDDYILSSKVGKLLKACKQNNGRSTFPFSPSPNNVVFDYSADGRRSVEDSLQRLGISDLDIVFVHDISSDNKLLPTSWQQQFEIALKGAFPALARMKEQGIIRGWGIGVNTPEPILRVIQEADPDVCLLASQYSLIDHANALNNVFPVARQHNVKFVIGSSLNAGFISGSPRYNYGKNSWDIPRKYIEKREKLRAVAAQYGVDLRTAALRFSAAPDVAAALIVGARSEEQVLANVTSMRATIPPDFWAELKRQKLIEQNAPTPS